MYKFLCERSKQTEAGSFKDRKFGGSFGTKGLFRMPSLRESERAAPLWVLAAAFVPTIRRFTSTLEPAESPTMSTGHKVGHHRIQGISDEFIPSIIELNTLNSISQSMTATLS